MTPMILMAATALSADNALYLELGTIGAEDPSWDAFSSDDVLPSRGFGGAIGVADDVSVTASYRYSARGADAELWTDEDEAWFQTAFYGHQLAAGAKYSPIDGALRPYLVPQAVALFGVARLDEDDGDDDNVNQLQASGLAIGGALNGGLELVLRDDRWSLAPAVFLELGYGRFSQLALDELGDVRFAGLTSRFGLGLHF